MKLALMLPAIPDESWDLALQMGVTQAITKLTSNLTGGAPPPYVFETLMRAKSRFEEAGFMLAGLEGDQFDMSRIKFGHEGREEDAERYRQMLTNMGALGINLLCYNFMAGFGWYRTSGAALERGGALSSRFRASDLQDVPLTEHGEISRERMWQNYEWFLQQVLPTAEEAGVRMGLHPCDPPVASLRGIGRIFTSAKALRRALSLSDSPSHALTLCLGTMTSAGENVCELIDEFAGSRRVAFVHFRDVRGTPDDFQETFHDNGPTDMAEVIELLKANGFDGPIRSDHVPAMAGESVNHFGTGAMSVGYSKLGTLFAVGYMRGILDTIG